MFYKIIDLYRKPTTLLKTFAFYTEPTPNYVAVLRSAIWEDDSSKVCLKL